MTLEEIERESAKLTAEERATLAARLLMDSESRPSAEIRDEPELCVCPSCQKSTKRIEIETEAADWGRIQFLGRLAAWNPDTQRAKVCEHCGHVFDRTLVTNPVTDRIVQFLFFGISGIGLVWLIVMIAKEVLR
ncbi:hypothetical protein [Luteolibacter soli]|uniref:Uncharacterized protein n=1 Tax=Luteolibacter soli TaxID=3135280 RepID=A0ABU9AZ89_9BACT